ncbi:elongation factor G [Prosthecochloris sp. N3]|uniref:Elongation factor G n=1 Tax=Prosthecochloris ethylica TaxID=2743976 RepID=A0ABR9XR12_9CHLB|nr:MULTISPECIES: elongation factor G [Prosthecochloris]MBF0586423.1 elongation factor G [Prosthecochloris ethylica]MBF0636359.1 elongation factor G [Prosthecochloris ethylica]NUK47533.1 elongation factor G [Prosthecochloris ethylica]RNA64214.1 elongation factor G [Prosthecochloris sp. ZM_2]
MQAVQPDQLRNIVITGHTGSGKTMLAESLALSMNIINRLGSIEEGTTLSDYAEDEIARNHSLNTSIIHGEWNGAKINVIDTPGLLDFHGDVKSAMRVADTVMIAVNASTGAEVGTDMVWEYTQEYYKPTMFILTKLDADRTRYAQTIEELQEQYGHLVTPIQFPAEEGLGHHIIIDVLLMKQLEFNPDTPGSMTVSEIPDLYRKQAEELHYKLVEAVAETDEELMNRYFEVGTLTEDELRAGIKSALLTRTFFPVFCTSPLHLIGSERLLNAVVNLCPSPIERGPEHAWCSTENHDSLINPDPEGPTVAFIFKTLSEPRLGEISYLRVYSGHIETGHELIDAQTGQLEKIGQVYTMEGEKKIPVDKLLAGDIGMVVKLKDAHTNDTLADKGSDCRISPISFPKAVYTSAVVPVAQGDEEKISAGLQHLHEEDPSFSIEHDAEFNQTILRTLGETHLDIILNRLEKKFNVSVTTEPVRIPYRETIRTTASAQGKYKKQSGGRGQYGDVWVRLEPAERESGFEFASEVVGGVVPTRYLPAVEKGLKETASEGILCGYPVVDIRAVVYDGSHHPVDSSEFAFKIASSMAFRHAFEKAKPMLLEPYCSLNVIAPDQYTGEIVGEISSRRGKIMGMDTESRFQTINAMIPQASLHEFHTRLVRLTQSRARYTYEFSHYEEVPQDLAQQLIEEHNM